MDASHCDSFTCECGAMCLDPDAARFGSRLGDDGILVYERVGSTGRLAPAAGAPLSGPTVVPMSAESRVDEIHALVRKRSGTRRVLSEATDLHADLGLSSLDLDEFLDEFAKRFRVDLSGYLWYFHTDDDGVSPGRLFFPAPQDRVQRIPLKLALLYQAAELGRWPVDYPEYSLPRRRWDLVFNHCLAAGAALWLAWRLAHWLF